MGLCLSSAAPGVDIGTRAGRDSAHGDVHARAHGVAPVRRGHPAYEYMNDRDGDGVVCE